MGLHFFFRNLLQPRFSVVIDGQRIVLTRRQTISLYSQARFENSSPKETLDRFVAARLAGQPPRIRPAKDRWWDWLLR